MTDQTRTEGATLEQVRAAVPAAADVARALRTLLRCRAAEACLPAGDGTMHHAYDDGSEPRVHAIPGPDAPEPGPDTDVHVPVRVDGGAGWLGARGAADPDAGWRFLDAVAALLESGSQTVPRPRGAGPNDLQGPPTDHLTGLGSHQTLEEQAPLLMLDDEVAGRRTALLMLDIDEFKLVNDTLGHAAGDAVLVGVADRLRTSLRDTDLVCRVGGDEFAVLATGLADESDADVVARKLLQALAPEIAVEDLRLHVDVSVGVAVRGVDGDSLADLVRAADRAMYAAKAAGSGQYRRAATTQRPPTRRVTPVQLTDAIREGALVLHHQPQFDAETGAIVATEASPRWQHRDLGTLRPDEVLPLAEQAGLLGTIDEGVVALAVRDLARLHAESPALRVSANISPRALLGSALVDHVARCLAESRVPAELLTLEVPEPASQYSRSTAQVLAGLEQLGCRVSVHEFGTARTSLGVLARFAGIREVKIAPHLVRMLAERGPAERTVRAIVAGAHALDILVVAEGIESRADADRLHALGCDVLQGDHLSPAVSLAEVVALVAPAGAESA
jgi:diguanylate cyclase